MMTLAQRVRDYRYSKGWGPDELASRAAISRTALYQIESGKTELPRAGTLRRIALALDISMDTLLGHAETAQTAQPAIAAAALSSVPPRPRTGVEWFPSEGVPLSAMNGRSLTKFDSMENGRFGVEVSTSHDANSFGRDRELSLKFHELLLSPFGESVARIVEETHRLLPQTRVVNGYE